MPILLFPCINFSGCDGSSLFFSHLHGGRHSTKTENSCILQYHFLALSMSWHRCCWVPEWNRDDSALERVTHFLTITWCNVGKHILSTSQKNTVIHCCGFGIVLVHTERDRVLSSRMQREGKVKKGKERRRSSGQWGLHNLDVCWKCRRPKKFSRDRTRMGGAYLLCALQINHEFPDLEV